MKGRDPFCTKEIEHQRFLVTKHMMVVYDIAPVLPGHSLIIPIRHVESIEELSQAEANDLFMTIKRVVPVLSRIYGDDSESYDFVTQIGPYSGRTIGHLHFHLVPRSRKDKYSMKGVSAMVMIDKAPTLSMKELSKEVKKLRKEFAKE